MKFKPCIVAVAAAAALSVCTGCRTVYITYGTPIPGKADSPTMYDLDTSATELARKMLASPLFMRSYKAAKTRKSGALPVVTCGDIKNNTHQHIDERLLAVRNHIRIALLESELVGANDDAADFLLIGDFSHFEDAGGYNTFKLHLALHDLSSGDVVWEGCQTMIKL